MKFTDANKVHLGCFLSTNLKQHVMNSQIAQNLKTELSVC